MFKGKVIKSDSLDPYYKVKFNFLNDKFEINNGEAIFTRKSPLPKVAFDDYTDYLIEKMNINDDTLRNIHLEIGKTVLDYICKTYDIKK